MGGRGRVQQTWVEGVRCLGKGERLMAIKTRGLSKDGGREMTVEEFKRWLKKFDSDKDGKISREELQDAVRFTGGWFSTWKHRRAVNDADADGNGFIDDVEMNNLVEFAQRTLGVKIVTF